MIGEPSPLVDEEGRVVAELRDVARAGPLHGRRVVAAAAQADDLGPWSKTLVVRWCRGADVDAPVSSAIELDEARGGALVVRVEVESVAGAPAEAGHGLSVTPVGPTWAPDSAVLIRVATSRPPHRVVHVRSRAVVRAWAEGSTPCFDLQGLAVASVLDSALLGAIAARPDFDALVLVEVVDGNVTGPRFLELATVRDDAAPVVSCFRLEAQR